VTVHEVFCPGIAETLIVEVGDGDDTVDVSAAPIALVDGGVDDDLLLAANASGGAGNDVLRGIGPGGRLRGGPGDDTILGGPGNDILAIDGGNDRLDGGRGNDSYILDVGARGIAATIADSGGDPRDAISLTCKGARLTAAAGTRERRGRYALPGAAVTFAVRSASLRAPEGRRADTRARPSRARRRRISRRQGRLPALHQGPARKRHLAASGRLDGCACRQFRRRLIRATLGGWGSGSGWWSPERRCSRFPRPRPPATCRSPTALSTAAG
jgi:hypothetical protein